MTVHSTVIRPGADVGTAFRTAARWLRALATGVDSFLAMFLTAVPSASTASEEVG